MSEIANPREYLPHLIVWSTFNIFAALAIAALLLVTLVSQRRAADRALLNLEAIFILTSVSGSILVWTGHALDTHPPYALCLFNAAIGMANVPLMAGAALAVVLKVWGSVMIACHIRTRGVVQWIIWKPFLLALPYLSGLPLFIAGLIIGTRDPSKVYRGSPLYCVVENPGVQNTASAFGAAYTFSCLVLSVWTTINLVTTRRRVRRIIEYPGVSYSFVCRTLFFSIFVSVAFVVGILSLVSTFSAIVPDVVLSSCAVAVFFIFSTAKVRAAALPLSYVMLRHLSYFILYTKS
ncbi:hypothetical protein DFH08DRAFT_777924 [Mycena albidolilacea]|uniref:Uncharacterized protein n=1 Tax=Mycena albidolilacea TaxID=1033008 RepID=A0AAD7EU61_9AGAR|nr:hypothetical protein DFH08DRAFT_777924 [Mycena albidolilacea]